jgi:glycosyltransferase involved in cell wall biosynthesis
LIETAAPSVEFIGEIGDRDKNDLLGGAAAMLFPIDWPEPFGLVMIEALACGTPVIGWRRGSVPEVVEDSVTGYIVESVEEAVKAVSHVHRLSREMCRRSFEERFDARRMAVDYLRMYEGVISAA